MTTLLLSRMDVTKCSDTETLLMVLIHAHSRTHESLFSCKFNLTKSILCFQGTSDSDVEVSIPLGLESRISKLALSTVLSKLKLAKLPKIIWLGIFFFNPISDPCFMLW